MLLSTGRTVLAQPAAPSRVTLDAGLLWDRDRTWSREASTAVPGATAAVAVRVRHGVGLRVDVDLPPWSKGTQTFATRDYQAAETVRHRMPTAALALQWRTGLGRRLDAGAHAGAAVAWRQETVEIAQTRPGLTTPGLDGARHDVSRVDRFGTFTVGGDLAVRLGRRVAIVPSVVWLARPFSDVGTTAVRARVACRWTF